MSSSPHHWFVQTDFGALLGPMPDDALAEMARTGALLIRDQVREGTGGEWRPASEVPGLFDEQTPSLGLMSSTLEDLFAPDTSAPRESAASPNANRRVSGKTAEVSVVGTSNELEFEIDAPLIAPPKVVEPPPVKYELEFEVDVPLIAPTATRTPPPVVERRQAPQSTPATTPAVSNDLSRPPKADQGTVPSPHRSALPDPPLVNGSENSQPPTVAPQPEPTRVDDPAPPAKPIVVPEPELALQPVLASEAPVAPAPRWQPPTARARPKAPLGKTAWITGAITTVALLAIVAAWWFWPRQRPDIYANYVAIYKELQQRKAAAQDQAGWREFVKRAKPQLDETLPWLEEQAQPGDREKSLLLYAGRDLQELLNQPSSSPGPHQKRLSAFFEQLEEMYAAK